MAMEEMTITEFRADAFETINRVVYQGEMTVLTRRGKPVAAIVPYEIGEILDRLLDELDLAEALELLRSERNKAIPAEQVFEELGL